MISTPEYERVEFPALSGSLAVSTSMLTLVLYALKYPTTSVVFFCICALVFLTRFTYASAVFIEYKSNIRPVGLSPELTGYRMCLVELKLSLSRKISDLEYQKDILENDRSKRRLVYNELVYDIDRLLLQTPPFLRTDNGTTFGKQKSSKE